MHRIATASAVGTLLAATVIGVSAFGGSAPARANLRSPPPLCQAGPITINDGGPASPYPSSCLQQALPGAISDVNVSIYGLNHTYPDDIDMLLVSPDGQNVTFLSDVGGDTDVVGCGLSIDDEREQALPDTGGIVCHAAYRPADYEPGDVFPAPAPVPGGNVDLSTFDGGPAERDVVAVRRRRPPGRLGHDRHGLVGVDHAWRTSGTTSTTPAATTPAATTTAATSATSGTSATSATAAATAAATTTVSAATSDSVPRPPRPRAAARSREDEDSAGTLRGRQRPPRPLEAFAAWPCRLAEPEAGHDQAPELPGQAGCREGVGAFSAALDKLTLYV